MRCMSLIVALAILAPGARAETAINTYLCWDGHVTTGWGKIAQSFVVPDGDPILSFYAFVIAPEDTIPTITFSIHEWDSLTGPIGDAIFSVDKDWPDAGGEVRMEGIDLLLVEGDLYAAIVDLHTNDYLDGHSVSWMANDDCYPAGNASWWNESWEYTNSTWNTLFRAVFVGTTSVEISTWSRIKQLY